MAQSVQVKEMEDYFKRLSELLNRISKKMGDTESKLNSLEADISRLNGEVEALGNENMKLKENTISKGEYEEFMNRLINSLKGLLHETPKEGISEHLAKVDSQVKPSLPRLPPLPAT